MGRRIRIARESGEVFELLGSVRRGARESVRCTVSESGEIRLKHAGRNGGNVSIRNKTLAGIQRYGVAASVTSNQCLFRVSRTQACGYTFIISHFISIFARQDRDIDSKSSFSNRRILYNFEIINFSPSKIGHFCGIQKSNLHSFHK